MSLNETPSALRTHITFFGARNAGKSSLVNAITNQDLSVVSDYAGTTTDLVSKAMELLPAGPVVITDTPGFDDKGSLGLLRVKKTRAALNNTDIAVLVSDATSGLCDCDRELIGLFDEKKIPYIIAYSKSDLLEKVPQPSCQNEIYVSSLSGFGIDALKEKIASLANNSDNNLKLISDLAKPNDLVIMVVPIDSSAPKGRIILPQQQVLRDGLDSGFQMLVVKDTELENTLDTIGKSPSLVITDSQAFSRVSKIVPQNIPLTSFSILMARKKGFLDIAVSGAYALDSLNDGDKILICEGCTHHRQCEDIGTVKLPGWIKNYTKKNVTFEFTSGAAFPENLSCFALIIHCGGCMLTERAVKSRMLSAVDEGIPFTNYGTAIAHINGILSRSTREILEK